MSELLSGEKVNGRLPFARNNVEIWLIDCK